MSSTLRVKMIRPKRLNWYRANDGAGGLTRPKADISIIRDQSGERPKFPLALAPAV
jgi:hypothetical protein